MKLIFCRDCQDMFKLGFKMKTCECGRIKGRYINNLEAEVSEYAISVAIGNGSFLQAIGLMSAFSLGRPDQTQDRNFFIENAAIRYAWVRPNEGPGNPHCSVIKEKPHAKPRTKPRPTARRVVRKPDGDKRKRV